ncbi:MAG: hypothetical protein KKH98_08690, partial [Spirochaetes bacterium]|nr:hypothetical protein [Spirochaetota bacterium]
FLIAEYLDLLTYSPDNIIYITLNSPCVRQLFEGDTPAMSTRLKVMKRIIQKGIQLCVYISPFFPSLTDHNSIMKDLQELTAGRFSLYFENYNIKMGNWREIKKRLPEKLLHEYASIFGNIDNYKEYWKKIRKEIMAENKKYGYAIKFFIYPYDDYYRNEF